MGHPYRLVVMDGPSIPRAVPRAAARWRSAV